MSELTRELIEPTVTKKHIIGVIVLVGILVTAFAFSVFFVSLIFGTQRKEPSSNLEDADIEDAEQLEPHFPIDLDDLWDYLQDEYQNLSPEDLEDLEDLGIDISDLDEEDLADLLDHVDQQQIADFIQEMSDGDIDNYDLAMAGLVIAALLFSNVEVFRVYDYDNPIEQREDILWKYECFDQFNGEDWQCTAPMEYSTWPTYEDFTEDYEPSGSDLIKIKRALSTISGSNSMVLGSLFPVPNIIEESVSAPSLDNVLLFKNEFGSATGDLYFDTATDLNMTYDLFDYPLLPTPEVINNTAVDESYTPLSIQNRYLQLPGGINNYINTHNYFQYHYNILNTIINSGDNAFVVAYKIRDYLQTNFEYSFNELANDPPTGDVVEWFCDKQEGMSSEFASAFCAFTRAFGVASRFVDGYNSRSIEEFIDSQEGGKNSYSIKYRNIYNWAEIYVPYNTLGNGQWVQMDVLYDTFGEGGQPITTERFNISVLANFSNFFSYNKNQYAKFTAKINSTESNIVGRTITFRDITLDQTLDSNITDSSGFTSILIDTDSLIVGPHVIEGSIGVDGDTAYIFINGDVNVNLNALSPDPAVVNVSITPHTTFIEGFVEDSTNSQRISNVRVNFLLLYKGTNTVVGAYNYFSPMYAYTDSNGEFDTTLTVSENIPYGEYDFRVDFNGTWYGFEATPFFNINDSSDVRDFNVTKGLTYDILFSINSIPTRFPNNPIVENLVTVKRTNQINLTATVLDAETKTRLVGVSVDFVDYSNGNTIIGSDVSDAFGNASIEFTVGTARRAGPNLVYARIGSAMNYSYYIINESISINVQSYSTPLEIDISGTGQTSFNIQCELIDDQNIPIPYSQIEINMNRSLIDYSGYITPSIYVTPNFADSNDFDFNRGVLTSTPVNNYSIRLEFNGFFNLTNNPYPIVFILNYLNNYTYLTRQLKVYDYLDVKIFIEVDNHPTLVMYDEINKPQRYLPIETANFSIKVIQSGGNPTINNILRIYDVYDNNRVLDEFIFNGSTQNHDFLIPISRFWFAGIHKINVQMVGFSAVNSTFIIINKTTNVNLIPSIDTPRINNVVLRNSEGFTVSGYIMENGTGLRGLRVRVLLLDKSYKNISYYLIGNPFAMTNNNGNFSIHIDRVNLTCPQGQYYIRVDFNGTINLQETPGINPIMNYMINDSSGYILLNITAGVLFINSYYDTRVVKDGWYIGDDLYVYGYLRWDNNSVIENMKVNVTIKDISGNILDNEIDSDSTISSGFFNISMVVGPWPDNAQVWIYFYPYKYSNFQYPEYFYVEPYMLQVFRQT